MDLSQYQRRANQTNRNPADSREGRIAVVLAMAGEAGSIADLYKRLLRDNVQFTDIGPALGRELGDLLWFLAVSAEQHGLSLNDIAKDNLARAHERYVPSGERPRRFDAAFPEYERFPDCIVIQLTEQARHPKGRPHVRIKLVSATPNPFPTGPLKHPTAKAEDGEEKVQGFKVGEFLGNEVNDNASIPDQYRFHDALHLAFAAHLGWSPVLRRMLGLKRRSHSSVDEDEDGARASHAEEAVAAALAQIAKQARGFEKPEQVNEEVLDIVKAITSGHEVSQCMGWQWRDAIHAGFKAMRQLAENKDGYLTVDLLNHNMSYSPMKP